jgi:hypothetical protein
MEPQRRKVIRSASLSNVRFSTLDELSRISSDYRYKRRYKKHCCVMALLSRDVRYRLWKSCIEN